MKRLLLTLIGNLWDLAAVELSYSLVSRWLLSDHPLISLGLFFAVTLSLSIVGGFRIWKRQHPHLRTCGYAGGVIALAYSAYAITNFLFEMVTGPSLVFSDAVKGVIAFGILLLGNYLLCFFAGMLGGVIGRHRAPVD